MKKIVLTVAAVLSMTMAHAQLVGGYKATTKQNIALQGATVIDASGANKSVYLSDASASGWNDAEGKGFPIGFDFPFNGKTMKYFGVSSQGLINLSETEDMKMSHTDYFITQGSSDFDNLIFCYDKNAASYEAGNEQGIDPATISYKNTEEGLIVEWKNLGANTSSWGADLIGAYTMQIHLLKDGTIKYRFSGLSDVPEGEAGNVLLGLRGGNGEYICFKDLSAKESTYGSQESFELSPVNDGYTITLNTPGPVATPTAQPTNLETKVQYNNGSVSATVTFDKAEGVDNYLMVISEGAPTALPEDGKTYAKDDEIGNAKVMLAGQPGSWGTSAYDLNHASNYVITVYAYNSFGTEGPKYNTTEPLQGSFATAPEAPGEMSVVSTTSTSLKLSAAANAKGNKVFVAYNTKTANPGNTGNRAYVGTPDASLQAGDYLTYETDESVWNSETFQQETVHVKDTEAGKVAYFGEAGEFTVEGLDPSQSYYFIAYSYDPETGTFSEGTDFAQVWTSTNITVPYQLDLTGSPENQTPGGWTATPGDYNEGFCVDTDVDYSKVKSQTDGNLVFFCQNQEKDVTYKLQSPLIELTTDNTLSVDWHVHMMSGFFWSQKAAQYDEWNEDDKLEFVIYVDGERKVLKSYNSENAPINSEEQVYDENDTYDTSLDWHAESFDLAAYAGKNVQFGVEWLGASSSTLYCGIENIKLTGSVPTEIQAAVSTTAGSADYFNVNGMKATKEDRGILIQNSKKFVNK